MQRSRSTLSLTDEPTVEIFEVASEFDDPVVRKYAAVLRDAGVTCKSFQRPTIAAELVRAGIPEIPAGDIVDAFRKQQEKGHVGVFWDLENIGLPPNVEPLVALTALRDVINNKFGDIKEFKAYVDLAVFASDFAPETRVLFRDVGVEMVDAPHNRRKEVADKHIIVDALWFAVNEMNPIVCLISGDSDFSPLLSKLKMNGIKTIVISTSHHVRSLRQQSTWALSWPESFLPGAEPPRDPGQRNRSGGPVYADRRAVSPARSPQRAQRESDFARAQPPKISVSPNATPSFSDGVSTPAPSAAAPAATLATAGPTASSPPTDKIGFADLIDCVRQVQQEVGMKKVRRSAVGLLFKRINPVVAFRNLVADAEAAGIVKLGGRLGHAWIALASDNVHDDPPVPGVDEVSVASQDSTNTAAPATAPQGDWWICLRFNQTFSSYASLIAFTPSAQNAAISDAAAGSDHAGLQVLRLREPKSLWHRMAIGPFSSIVDADNYYQIHFGEMQLLPKITQNLKKYIDPSLFPASTGAST